MLAALLGAGDFETAPVRACQQGFLLILPASPNWSYGMNDASCRQLAGSGDDRVARWTALRIVSPCLFYNAGSAAVVDGAVHTPTSGKPTVGCVDDGIGRLTGNVADDQFQFACADGCLHRSFPPESMDRPFPCSNHFIYRRMPPLRMRAQRVECPPQEKMIHALSGCPRQS